METTQKPYAFSRKVFCEGMRDGVPIALGYFAVSFSLGIAARRALSDTERTHSNAALCARIMALDDPTKKMSKSEENPKGTIDLLDDPGVARKKIMSAVTDSLGTIQYDPDTQPGVSNLLMIHSSLSGESLESLVSRFQGKGYGDLKKETGGIVFDFLSDLQSRYRDIIASGKIDEILREGNEKASRIAERKLRKVKKKLGFQILK